MLILKYYQQKSIAFRTVIKFYPNEIHLISESPGLERREIHSFIKRWMTGIAKKSRTAALLVKLE